MNDEHNDERFLHIDTEETEAPSIEELEAEAPRDTDSANVDAFVRAHGKGYRYVIEWSAWVAWSGKRWELPGARGRVLRAAILVAREEHYRCRGRIKALQEELRPLKLAPQKDEDKIEQLEALLKRELKNLAWHVASQNQGKLDAVAKGLESRLVVRMADLDRDPWLLNVANGTIDLRTGDLRAHEREDLITSLIPVEYDLEAPAPTWTRFLSMVMADSLELTTYLQRLIGYTLTGRTDEHILVFHHGNTGSNGKSTFLATLRSLLGDYSCSAPRSLLFEPKNGAEPHPTELARLYGKRLAICAEVPEHAELAEAKIKDITGGDVVSVRRMNENFWDLTPTHTLHAAGNHKPVVHGTDGGIWRRIKLVPWTVTIDEADQDKSLKKKLSDELPGILAWAVHGCLEWQRIGLAEPGEVTEAGAAFRSESDVLAGFFASQCVFEPAARESCKAIRKAYESWCDDLGHRPLGARTLWRRFRERGTRGTIVRYDSKPVDGLAGVRLKSAVEQMREAAEIEGSNAVWS
jgi:putative DNA primase/helicase